MTNAWPLGGPYKLIAYKIDPPTKDPKAAAYMKIDLGEKQTFERWLIAGERHTLQGQKARECEVSRERIRVRPEPHGLDAWGHELF